MEIDQGKYEELGFNDYFISHLTNHNPRHVLGFRCEPPYHVFSSPLIERNIFPLWECGITTVYFNEKTNKFEVCNLEDIDDVWESYSSIQGLFAYLLLQLWEDEKTDEEIVEIGNAIGFKFVSQLLQEAESAEDYSTWRETFPRQCS